MKKLVLLLSLSVCALGTKAQLSLSGASPYTQNFDGIATSLPTGWSCYYTPTSTSLGTLFAWSGDTKFGVWADTVGNPGTCQYCADTWGTGFKNSASADVAHATDTGGTQRVYTNRALAVKQASNTSSHPGYDPGAAFVLHLTNTHGITNLGVQFNLQSLDYTDPRTTTWTIDYGIGTSPTTFTPVTTTTGTWTTGNLSFTNNAVTASFGTALDNQSSEVWIRIVTLTATTGSGQRPCSGIDDFKLTWTGTATGTSAVATVAAQTDLALTVIGNPTSDKISFKYSTEEAGSYNLSIYDMSGRVLHNENVTAKTGAQQITVNGLNLAAGMYFAKMSNGNSSSVAKISVQ
jgi:hypothetical protein